MVHINLGRNKREILKQLIYLAQSKVSKDFAWEGEEEKVILSPSSHSQYSFHPALTHLVLSQMPKEAVWKQLGMSQPCEQHLLSIMYKELQGILKDKQQQKGAAEFFGVWN